MSNYESSLRIPFFFPSCIILNEPDKMCQKDKLNYRSVDSNVILKSEHQASRPTAAFEGEIHFVNLSRKILVAID